MNRYLRAGAGAVFAAGVLVAAGCGGGGGDDERRRAAGNGTDVAFARAMVPHHEMAVEMADVARERGGHREVRQMAAEVISSQTREIRALRRIALELKADGMKAGGLGVPEHMTGMGADMNELESARRFDREFIAMMVPHHQGAIRMARVELRRGGDPRLRRIAREIIEAQQREIDQMRSWSQRWYGAAPAGGEGDHGMHHEEVR